MGVVTTFIVGTIAGGATWEIYKRRDTLFSRRKDEIQLDQLEAIHGIGPVYARSLNQAGILTYADLAQATSEQVIAIVAPEGKLVPDVDTWIREAGTLITEAE